MAAFTGPVLALPLVACVPVHPPEAVQLVAFVEVQVSVDELPATTLAGLADSVIVGTGGAAVTVTVTLFCVVPPLPVQSSAYVDVLASNPVDSLPLVDFDPLHAPPAEQLVAPTADQVMVELPPATTVSGLALSVTTGTAGVATCTVAVEVALPPAPEQVSVKVLLLPAARALVLSLPLTGLLPDQPAEAAQLSAFDETQDSIVVPGPDSASGVAVSVTDGESVPPSGRSSGPQPASSIAAAMAPAHDMLMRLARARGLTECSVFMGYSSGGGRRACSMIVGTRTRRQLYPNSGKHVLRDRVHSCSLAACLSRKK